jgi:hypothetical protein
MKGEYSDICPHLELEAWSPNQPTCFLQKLFIYFAPIHHIFQAVSFLQVFQANVCMLFSSHTFFSTQTRNTL